MNSPQDTLRFKEARRKKRARMLLAAAMDQATQANRLRHTRGPFLRKLLLPLANAIASILLRSMSVLLGMKREFQKFNAMLNKPRPSAQRSGTGVARHDWVVSVITIPLASPGSPPSPSLPTSN
jgi:hypothetical protein